MIEWPARLNAYEFFLGDRLREGLAERPALRLDDQLVDFGSLDRLVAGYERALIETGVQRLDRVLIVLPDGSGFAAALLATIRMGAVAVMPNPGLTGEAMGAMVDLSRAGAAFVHSDHDDDFRSSLRQWSPPLIDPLRIGPGRHSRAPADTAPDDPAIWLFSGGTTGLPKAVPQTHKSLVNSARLYGQGSLGLTPEDITISVPKLYFGYAMGSNLLFPLSVGGSTVLFEGHPTPEALFRRIEQHRPTVLIDVPSAINQMLSAPGVGEQDFSCMRVATSAGEALPETLYHRWKEVVGVELLDGLGTAEMWHIFITNTVDDVKPGTLGKVVPGFAIKACDDEGVEVAPGDVGRLWVKGDSLGLGYFGNPEQTDESFRGEWFVGGDLISIDEEGYVTHRGRADDALKVKGKWFRPLELESVLLDHPAVRACAVVTIEDSSGLARPVAFVVSSGEVSDQELIDWSLQRLEPYKHPRQVFFVDELPQTHLGKVDRSALKRMAG